jgi:hypothetical protein
VQRTGGAKLTERFTAIEDPYGAFGILTPHAVTTDPSDIFDDCFMIASKTALPPDFRLKVEQEHLLSRSVVGKNQITDTPNQIAFCHFDRLPNSCDFGKRCKP